MKRKKTDGEAGGIEGRRKTIESERRGRGWIEGGAEGCRGRADQPSVPRGALGGVNRFGAPC